MDAFRGGKDTAVMAMWGVSKIRLFVGYHRGIPTALYRGCLKQL